MLRHINESYIKEKWIMKIETIKQVIKGYNSSSPIETSTYIFSKKPT
jgi:hypothetical protein